MMKNTLILLVSLLIGFFITYQLDSNKNISQMNLENENQSIIPKKNKMPENILIASPKSSLNIVKEKEKLLSTPYQTFNKIKELPYDTLSQLHRSNLLYLVRDLDISTLEKINFFFNEIKILEKKHSNELDLSMGMISIDLLFEVSRKSNDERVIDEFKEKIEEINPPSLRKKLLNVINMYTDY
jgi:hypothetical protein